MFRLLIFGGTTEGRQLAEFCAENGISTDVSVATEYGASLLPEKVGVLCGRLDASQMKELIRTGYSVVIDATHPYAIEATENIRLACTETGIRYLRLIRKSEDVYGKTVSDMDELISYLDQTSGTILSTLGSKSLPLLTKIKNFRKRLWVRVLPSADIYDMCCELGYDTAHIIQEKGKFTVEQNIAHIQKSGALILITKESGSAGGYAEKAEAARICGTELVTLTRPAESGYRFDEIVGIIKKESGR